MNGWWYSASGDDEAIEEQVQFLVTSDGQLKVSGNDPNPLFVLKLITAKSHWQIQSSNAKYNMAGEKTSYTLATLPAKSRISLTIYCKTAAR